MMSAELAPLTARVRPAKGASVALPQLAAESSRRERRRVEVQVVARRIRDHRVDLVLGGGYTARGFAVRPREMLVIEEIDPVWPLAAGCSDVQMKGGNLAFKPFPIDAEAGLFSLLTKV